MENAFAVMKTITLPRAGGTEQQSVFVCVNGRTFQVPRGKAVEVPVSLAMGWASFDGAQDRELSDTQKRDDSAMYKDKLQIKARDRENGWTCDR